jgi:bifunctional DNA-binding transcriptional regulator/antitoxin component of YhaV-PrlF toxin-antitoxin module
MGVAEQSGQVEVESYVVRLRERGQMTVPRQVRERLAVDDGDVVRLVRVGDAYLLTPRSQRVPALADRIAELMEREGVSLSDLLAGLAEERRAIEAERRPDA